MSSAEECPLQSSLSICDLQIYNILDSEITLYDCLKMGARHCVKGEENLKSGIVQTTKSVRELQKAGE